MYELFRAVGRSDISIVFDEVCAVVVLNKNSGSCSSHFV